MSVNIENLTNRPVLLRLNSGKTLHLAAGAISSEVNDAEVNNNAKAQKLQDRHVIALYEIGKKKRPPADTKSADMKKEKVESKKEKK